jgi:hypothetical protein
MYSFEQPLVQTLELVPDFENRTFAAAPYMYLYICSSVQYSYRTLRHLPRQMKPRDMPDKLGVV